MQCINSLQCLTGEGCHVLSSCETVSGVKGKSLYAAAVKHHQSCTSLFVFSFGWIIKCFLTFDRGCWVLSVHVLIVENWCTRPWKRGQPGELRSHFSRKQPACLSLPGGFGSAKGSDWQTLTDRLTFTQRFLPALPGILLLRVLIFPPKPFHSQCIKAPHPTPPLSPSFNPARVFFPLSKQIWVGSFN